MAVKDRPITGTNESANMKPEDQTSPKNPVNPNAAILASTLILSGWAFGLPVAKADGTDSLWEYSLHTVQQCQGAMNQGMDSAAECVLGDSIGSLFDKGIGLANEQGRETFGENFRITGRMNW